MPVDADNQYSLNRMTGNIVTWTVGQDEDDVAVNAQQQIWCAARNSARTL